MPPRAPVPATPAESALTGLETCPAWAPTGTSEIHISGDIAVAVWQYWCATRAQGRARAAAGGADSGASGGGDLPWLRRVGYALLAGIADFWVARAVNDTPGAVVAGWSAGAPAAAGATAAGDGSGSSSGSRTAPLHITGVIPPTEFYHGKTDSVFTNAVAVLALRYAAAAAAALGEPGSVAAPWLDVAARLVVPLATGADAPPGHEAGPGVYRYFHPGYEWGGQVQLLDAVMLDWPFGLGVGFPSTAHGRGHPASADGADAAAGTAGGGGGTSAAMFASNLAYYTSVQDPAGSVAFAWAVNTIAYAEAGDTRRADEYLRRCHEPFVHGPFRVWTEGAGGWGCPNFVTGAGGLLQALALGYPRLRLNDTALSLRPLLPAGVRSLTLRGVWYLGVALDIRYDAAAMTIEAQPVVATEPVPRGHQLAATGGAAFDPASPATTPAEMLAARPWLDAAARVAGEQDDYGAAPRPLAVVAHGQSVRLWVPGLLPSDGGIDGPMIDEECLLAPPVSVGGSSGGRAGRLEADSRWCRRVVVTELQTRGTSTGGSSWDALPPPLTVAIVAADAGA
jgi:hypothetical protein